MLAEVVLLWTYIFDLFTNPFSGVIEINEKIYNIQVVMLSKHQAGW